MKNVTSWKPTASNFTSSAVMGTPKLPPTRGRVYELLHYDAATGVFTWKVDRGQRIKVGDIAGSVSQKGYLRIKIDGHQIRASRLAWFFQTGFWPKHEVDHLNGSRLDNRIDNLRDVTTKQNQWNRQRAKIGCRSGLLGAFATSNGKWASAITRDGATHWLGTFKCAEDAHAAYAEARAKLIVGSPPILQRLRAATNRGCD